MAYPGLKSTQSLSASIWYINLPHPGNPKAAFTQDATSSAIVAKQPRRKGIKQERLHSNTPAYIQQTCDCWEPRRQFNFELKTATRHRLSRAVFCEEHQPQKLPIHGLYGGVVRDSCLPCKRYCRAASRAAACLSCASRAACRVAHKRTLRSQSWSWMIDSLPFCSCQSALPFMRDGSGSDTNHVSPVISK